MSEAITLINQVRAHLSRLQKEYNQFFGGTTPVEPFESREALMEKVKRLRNLSNMRTEEQFQADNLIGTIQSYIMRWERQLNTRDGLVRKKRKPVDPENSAPPKAPNAPSRTITLRDGSQREQVVALYEEFVKMNVMKGNRKPPSFSKFQAFVSNQTERIKSKKQVQEVSFEVILKDDKVMLKSKT